MRRSLARIAALAALGLLGPAVPSHAADIYRCVDAAGVVHFSDFPTNDCFVRIIRVPPAVVAPAAPQPAGAAGLVRYEGLIAEAAARHKVEPALIKAIIRAESNFNPTAVSRKGALGLMQLMPATAGQYGVADPFEPRANIHGGARHLRALFERYGGNLELTLAAYNAGEQAVERFGGRIPPYAETRGYVRAVLRHLETYRRGPTMTARR